MGVPWGWWRVVLATVLATLAGLAAWHATLAGPAAEATVPNVAPNAASTAAVSLGRQIYRGEVALPGTIQGHAQPLPPLAARCTNCHSRESVARVAALSASGLAPGPAAVSFAPLLTRDRLLTPMARRGGPPSRYDTASFCRLLRTGIDPAYVLIPRQMPRYELSDAQCAALFGYLSDGGDTR